MLTLKRVYKPAAPEDELRVLVEFLNAIKFAWRTSSKAT